MEAYKYILLTYDVINILNVMGNFSIYFFSSCKFRNETCLVFKPCYSDIRKVIKRINNDGVKTTVSTIQNKTKNEEALACDIDHVFQNKSAD